MIKSKITNLSPGQGSKPAYKQCNIKKNHNLKSESAQKLYYENVWHINITKPIASLFFMPFTLFLVPIVAKFYCFSSSIVPELEANSVVPGLTTRYKEHCWWSLFSRTVISIMVDHNYNYNNNGKYDKTIKTTKNEYTLIAFVTTLIWKTNTLFFTKLKPGAHFTNNFSITIQMWWKFHFALIQILKKWSLQYLAHGTTAGLSWHVPNFVAIWSSVIELELSEISIEFKLWWKNR